jgi:hypothetical protein
MLTSIFSSVGKAKKVSAQLKNFLLKDFWDAVADQLEEAICHASITNFLIYHISRLEWSLLRSMG